VQEADIPQHEVIQGDCIESIAAEHGLEPDAIWAHANNASLREKRNGNSFALLPGDVLFVPDPSEKSVDVATDRSHTFVLKIPKTLLRIRFLDVDDQPREGLPYTLEIDGVEFEGTTTADGDVEQQIRADARSGTLTLNPGQGADEEVYTVELGHLDPIEETSGLQARLRHLGLYTGEVDGELGSRTRDAILAYQRAYGLSDTGEFDDETKSHLERQHGS
jgi:N-acetylmuramoyl-L-alanine amidase